MQAGPTQIFLSHSSRDRARCEALIAMFDKRDVNSIFIDFDPVDGIPPGRDWESELYRALRRCDVVIAVDSTAWRESRWCFAEVAIARSLGKRIILLRSPDAPAPSGAAQLLRDLQSFTLIGTEPSPDLFLELKRLGVGALRRFRWDPDRPPYAGLSPLDEADAGVFFGRDRDTRAVVDLIERCAKYGEKAVVLLIGPSGSGKSSLLRAGVLPQLRARRDWKVIGPMHAAASAPVPLAEVEGLPASNKALVALDQLDEALGEPGGAAPAMIASLVELVRRYAGRVIVVATLRVESLDLLNQRMGSLSEWIESFVVGPLTRPDYRDIIEAPAEVAGAAVEPDLVDALLADVASSGVRALPSSAGPVGHLGAVSIDAVSTDALPLLAVTLRQLWDRRGPASQLTLSAYKELGGFGGVIERTADTVMSATRLDDATRMALCEAFLGMVRLDRDGRVGRKPLPRNTLAVRTLEVLKRFEAEGLLITSATPGCIELAHEALIRTWPVLAEWVSAAREDLLRVERFEMALALWRDRPDALLEGLGLVEAEELAARGHAAVATEEAARLIEFSARKRDEAVARELERQHALRVSESLRLATEAREVIECEPATALRVAWEAVQWDRNELSETVFRETLRRMPAPVQVLGDAAEWKPHTLGYGAQGSFVYFTSRDGGWIETWRPEGEQIARFDVSALRRPWAVAPAPDRQALIVGSTGRLSLFDLSGRALTSLALPDMSSDAKRATECRLRVAPNGTGVYQQGGQAWLFELPRMSRTFQLVRVLPLIASASDARAPALRVLHRPYSKIQDIALDVPGGRLLSDSSDGTMRCWSLDGVLLGMVKPQDQASSFASAALLSRGRMVTSTVRGEGTLWSSAGEALRVFHPSTGLDLFIRAVDAGGEHFITASNRDDNELAVWNADGEQEARLDARSWHYWCATFSSDGRFVAAGCADGVVRLWEWRKQRLVAELHGHTGTVGGIAFDPGDASLLTGGHDRSVRLWSLDAPILPMLRGHTGPLRRMARSGTRLLTCGAEDDTTLLWTTRGETAILPGLAFEATPESAADLVVTQDRDGNVRLWRWPDPTSAAISCIGVAPRSSDGVATDAAVSPDGNRIVLVYDRAAALLSAGGERLATLIELVESEAGGRVTWSGIKGLGFQAGTGNVAIARRDGRVWRWTTDGEPLGYFEVDTHRGSPDPLLALAVDPLGELIVAGVRGAAELWDWDGQLIRSLHTRGYKVHQVAVSPDGRHVLTLSDAPNGSVVCHAQWWNRQGQLLADLDIHEKYIPSGWYFDPAGRYFVLRAHDLRIYAPSGELLGVLAGAHAVHPEQFAVSPDGESIAAQFGDGLVRIWSLSEHRRVMSIRTGSGGPMAFSVDGQRLLSAMPSGSIEQHALDISELFAGAAARLDRGLNADEITRFSILSPVRLNLAAHKPPP